MVDLETCFMFQCTFYILEKNCDIVHCTPYSMTKIVVNNKKKKNFYIVLYILIFKTCNKIRAKILSKKLDMATWSR